MDRSSLSRSAFICTNILIIMAGVVAFIIGNIYYSKDVGSGNYSIKLEYTGSFVGGPLAVVSLLFIIYGLLGVYAGYKNNRIATGVYLAIAIISIVSRFLFWSLTAMHHLVLENIYYSFVCIEICLIVIATLFFYAAK